MSRTAWVCAGVLSWVTIAGVRAVDLPAMEETLKVVPKKAEAKKSIMALKEPVELPFYVFNNAIFPPVRNFAGTGFMGDVNDITMVGSYTELHQKEYPSLKIIYAAMDYAGWAGVFWQNPANNWGEVDGRYNLSKAKKLSFWARGEKGGEVIVAFQAGGILQRYPDSDVRALRKVTLTGAWKQYTIDLTGADFRFLSGGFSFFVRRVDNPEGCSFYLDDIKYE